MRVYGSSPCSPFPRPSSLAPVLAQQKRAITFDDYIALPVVSDPQLSPDGKWVAYTVTTPSLKDNRGIARIWLAEWRPGRPGSSHRGRAPTARRAGRPTARRWRSSPRGRVDRRSG